MNLRHKMTAAIACLLLAITVTGCGGDGGDGSSDGGTDETSARTIFSDSFADDANWTYFDDTLIGTDWSVVNGKLNQSVNLEAQDYFYWDPTTLLDPPAYQRVFDSSTSYHLGTYALLSDSAVSGVDNYRFSVDISPLRDSLTNPKGNDVGIMFGYEDEDNYYRVSMNARYGYTRLEKRSGGDFETLKVNARGYEEDQSFTMTVEVNGNTIVVWIDGDPVFAERDPDMLSGTVALYCQDNVSFDNALMTENPSDPLVALLSPLAYSVALTQDDFSTLVAEALVLNKPSGGYVEFKLDGGDTETGSKVAGNLYRASFTGVSDGEHEVTAVLRNADGSRADIDINSTVGVGGDYYVAVGDSITNGFKDDDASNNDSADGRIISLQGYEAPLADFLTDATGLPQIVFNEGIQGEKASDLMDRIESILDRHPGANKVLLMVGTNDTSVPVDASDFRDQVEDVVDQIVDAGKSVWLAEVMPTDEIVLKNTYLVQYNSEVWDIADSDGSDDIFHGPDFYALFLDGADPDSTLYADEYHPNDAGYQVMAGGWDDVLP